MTASAGFRLPRPFPDPKLYAAILQAGFETYPERKVNYERYKQSRRDPTVNYLPVKLDIENVSRCNYHCSMCEVSEWPKFQRAGDMSLEDFKHLLDEQYGVIEIKLQGLGEPTLGKCLPEMIAYARSRHIWVRSTTNASLLHLKDNYKRVIDSDVCELGVSIDGATKATYEAIRRGGIFERVQENCKRLNEYARQVGRHRTRMTTVVQKGNFDELEQLVDLAAELGFIRQAFSLDVIDFGLDRWNETNSKVDMHQRFTVERGQELIERGKRLGVEVTYWIIEDKYDNSTRENLCPWPFERLYVSSDMKMVPCCLVGNPDVYSLGNARTLSSDWNAEAMQQFRRMHIDGKVPRICSMCYKAKEAP